MVDFNRAPYYDDFDETKRFYRILFRPGFAVQARELTQLQSILQNQIKNLGSAIFKDGSRVIGAQTTVDLEYNYVKLVNDTISPSVQYFREALSNGQRVEVVGQTSGVKAVMVNITPTDGTDPDTIFVKYKAGGTIVSGAQSKVFQQSEVLTITVYEDNSETSGTETYTTTVAAGAGVTGLGSSISISEGVRFVKGVFAYVQAQTLILSKYTNTPTKTIGLKVVESVVTPEEDYSLLDNATGSANEAAPGAHRYTINMLLTDVETEEDFILLARLKAGKIEFSSDDIETINPEFSRALAERVKDQSGDFIVTPFNIVPREHLRLEGNDGKWFSAQGGDEDFFVLEIEKGRAYVGGYPIEQTRIALASEEDTTVEAQKKISKARDAEHIENIQNLGIISTYGNYFLARVADATGTTDINGQSHSSFAIPLRKLYLLGSYTYNKVVPAASVELSGSDSIVTFKYKETPLSATFLDGSGTPDVPATWQAPPTGMRVFVYDSGFAGYVNVSDNSPSTYSPPIYAQVKYSTDGGEYALQIKFVGVDYTSAGVDIVVEMDDALVGTFNVLTYADEPTLTDTTPTASDLYRLYASNIKLEHGAMSSVWGFVEDHVNAGFETGIGGDPTYVYGVFTGCSSATPGASQVYIEPTNKLLVRKLPNQFTKELSDISYDTIRRFTPQNYASPVTKTVSTGEQITSTSVLLVPYSSTGSAAPHVVTGTLLSTTQIQFQQTVGDGTAKYAAYISVRKSTDSKRRLFEVDELETHTVVMPSAASLRNWSKGFTISLPNTLVTELTSVKDSLGNNLTAFFELQSGQTDNYIGQDYLALLPGNESSVGGKTLTITYKFLRESGSGGEFSDVSSYPVYADIPEYSSVISGVMPLRDCVDFRPRYDSSAFSLGRFDVLSPSVSIVTDVDYYIGRIDKLFVTKDGYYKIIKGTPSIKPQPPKDLEGALLLAEIEVPPYTASASDVIVRLVEHKRYTFKDISAIERRVSTLEYYSTLSLLEKNTAERVYLDETNLDRFKNGFVVDAFSNQDLCDTSDAEFDASVDLVEGELRPSFNIESVDLEMDVTDPDNWQSYIVAANRAINPNTGLEIPYNGTISVGGASTNLRRTGDVITLDYDDVVFIDQPMASKVENVNPFDVISWTGEIQLSPDNDTWIDTEFAPPLVTTIDQFKGVKLAGSVRSAYKSVWNFWQNVWAGRPSKLPISAASKLSRATTTVTNSTLASLVGSVNYDPRTKTKIENASEKVIAERIVNLGIIPFLRERTITFKARRLKPNTRVYPFFDGADVSAHVTLEGATSASDVTPLVTDANGDVSGTFVVPNTDTLRFRTGRRTFRLIDSANNIEDDATTFAEATYNASGVLETRQRQIQSVREATIVVSPIAQINRLVRIIPSSGFRIQAPDPLAQSFFVEENGGVFLTGVDIYFARKPTGDVTPPVTVQIRGMQNGIPDQTVFPFSSVTITADEVATSSNGATPTHFKFPSPVYLQSGNEYCLFIMSMSTEYEVYVSRLGEYDTVTGNRILKQPSMGVLFKSQNTSTWTEEQLEDLKFTLYRADFTTTAGTFDLRVKDIGTKLLGSNPLKILQSGDIGPPVVPTVLRVYAPNHGLVAGSQVTISGVTGTGTPAKLFGLDIASINATHTVIDTFTASASPVPEVATYNTDDDYFLIEINDAPIGTVPADPFAVAESGGSAVRITHDIQMNVIQPILSEVVLPDTSINWSVRSVLRDALGVYSLDSFRNVNVSDNIEFRDAERVIPSLINAPSGKPLQLRFSMSTSNPNISPVIDLQRNGLVAVGNRINDDSSDPTAQYITKVITLNDPAITIRSIVEANVPTDCDFEMHYRTLAIGEEDIKQKEWVPMVMTKDGEKTDDYGRFNEFEFSTGTLADDNIDEFVSFQIKIVMLSSNSAKVPRFTSLRAIALGT